jgi:hypothetical protein
MSETNTTLATVKPAREVRVVESSIALFDTAKFEHLNRIAMGMANCMLIPEHLAGTGSTAKNNFKPFDPQQIIGNCLLVVNQAHRWDVDPFALAAETYVLKGKLGYQGKLIKAIIDARAGLTGGLHFRYNSKQGNDFAIVVYGYQGDMPEGATGLLKQLAEENDRSALSDLQDMGVEAVRLAVNQIKTENDMWTRDPEQKLVYSGSMRWARRYRPALLLGIRSDDDIEKETEVEPLPRAILPAPKTAPSAEPVVTKTDAAPEVLKSAKPPAKKPKPEPAKATDATQQYLDRKIAEGESPVEVARTEPAETAPTENTAEEQEPDDTVGKIRYRLKAAGYSEDELVKMAIAINFAATTAKTIVKIAEEKLQMILDDWDTADGGALDMLQQLRERDQQKGGK